MKPRIIYQSTSLTTIIDGMSTGLFSMDIDEPTNLWITNTFAPQSPSNEPITHNVDETVHIKPIEMTIQDDDIRSIIDMFKPNVNTIDGSVYDYIVLTVDDGNVANNTLVDLLAYRQLPLDSLFGSQTWSLLEMSDKELSVKPIVESTNLHNEEGII